ncbi:hypothetical protein N0V90_009578 [Kalmusia sp. IMI 367209]|nr:hypothetical protein N0V90_009578 [Kalmusia sp. IMI 367209]
MEYDTSKTFREIHSTPSALIAELQKIERLALSRSSKLHHSTHPIHLRFLTPLNPQPRNYPSNTVHLRLTPPHEHTENTEYIAVSYTWQQPESLTNAFANSIPSYKIWSTDPKPRAPNCNPIVLHRAYQFAQAKLDRVLIWIDQECIQQDDIEDVENHLQAMHEIYRRSAFTVVLLSSMIDSVSMAAGLYPFVRGSAEVFEELIDSDDCRSRELCLLALQRLAKDRWFSRTWTYQERFFANACHYVVPVSPVLGLNTDVADPLASRDWCIPEQHLVSFSDRMKHLKSGYKGHLKLDLRIPFESDCSCKTVALTMMRLTKFKFEASRSTDHRIHVPGFENFGIRKVSTSTVGEAIRNMEQYTEADHKEDVVKGQFETVNAVFRAMEGCENAVVADRIPIFANVCQFGWTLQTVRFRTEIVSYSTCVLSLLILNVLKMHDGAWKMRLAEKVMGMTVGDFIKDQLYPFSKVLYGLGMMS